MMIQIFANDHRHNQDWNLPYIRFGGPESDCLFKVPNEISGIQVNADETPKLYWLWKKLDEFGCDIIGYCHYRRFFSRLNTGSDLPLHNLTSNQFKFEYAMPPDMQAAVIQQQGVDGILHPPFQVINRSAHPYTYIWEQVRILTNEDMFPADRLETVFRIFKSHAPDWLQPYIEKAFEIPENYLCNIFTVKKDVFRIFGQIAFPSAIEVLNLLTVEEKSVRHPYWLAYLFERYTSLYYHAVQLAGKYRFAHIPLLTVDGNKHIKVSKGLT